MDIIHPERGQRPVPSLTFLAPRIYIRAKPPAERYTGEEELAEYLGEDSEICRTSHRRVDLARRSRNVDRISFVL